MEAILGGLGAAVAWALSTLCSSRSSRLLDPFVVVAWVAVFGLVLAVPAVVVVGVPHTMTAGDDIWLALSGIGTIAGLMFAYTAFRTGKVILIAPLISTEGAIAALIATVTGEHVAVASGIALVTIAIGVAMAATSRASGSAEGPLASEAAEGLAATRVTSDAQRHHDRRVLPLAGMAALCFGFNLYATGHVSSSVPLAWVVMAGRGVGALVLALPLAFAGRLRFTRRSLPLLICSGVCEVLGIASYAAGARHGIAVAAVVGSQFAVLSVLGGYLLFGERLGRLQVAGVVTVIVAVTVLSALQG